MGDLQIVNFHYVTDQAFPGVGIAPVGTREFRAIIAQLVRERDPLSLVQISALADCNGAPPKNSCLITFDDGLRCQWDNALPILEELGVPAIFFVCSQPMISGELLDVHKLQLVRTCISSREILALAIRYLPEAHLRAVDELLNRSTQYRYDDLENRRVKLLINFVLPPLERKKFLDSLFQLTDRPSADDFYMQRDEWCWLAENDALGAHSHVHMPLASLTADEIESDLHMNRKIIEECTGFLPNTLSYPYGGKESFSLQTGEIASRLGFQMGFTMERSKITNLTEPHFLPRFDVRDLFPRDVV